MHILGISAFYHDSAACLVRDGEIVAAAQEERFTRKKHDAALPERAIAYCLREAGITGDDLDFVGFYEKPMRKFDRLMETYLAVAPRGFRSFRTAVPSWLGKKLWLPPQLDRGIGRTRKSRYVFTTHHEAHAASAFFPSPFDDAAIVTLDGVGEWSTTTVGHGRANRITISQELRFPHSLGLLYSAFTYYTGFEVNEGEYKVMGLAPYGEPRFVDDILTRLVDLKDDGSFRLDMSYFNYLHGLTMTSRKFDRLFGGPPRRGDEPLAQRHMDLAASVQRVTEEIMLRVARHARAQTGARNLCLAGGVALNCVGNGRILREAGFDDIWIQPAAGDAGGALGAAMFIWHQILERPRSPSPRDSQRGSLLGPTPAPRDDVGAFLQRMGAAHHRLDEPALLARVAGLIADGKVVGWVHGRLEFGPRALGARSILGDARDRGMQTTMNVKVKFRESFRPFAPAVLEERAAEYFELKPGQQSPYMLLVAPVRAVHRLPVDETQRALKGMELLRVPRSDIPAVTHVDYSARIQTVDAARFGRFRTLLDACAARDGGVPVVVNTSFNLSWEPIVNTAEEAYHTFMSCDMDALVIDDTLLLKAEQRANVLARHTVGGRETDPALEGAWCCPRCAGTLDVQDDAAICQSCRQRFVRTNGVWQLYWPHEGAETDVTERVKQFYEEHPFPNYDEHDTVQALIAKSRRGIYARLLSEQIPFNSDVLEVGCGTGQLANFLGVGCRSVTGVDLCLNSLRLAEDFRVRHGLSRVRFAQMNLFRPALRDEQYDVVLCNGVLHHTSDPFGGLQRVARLVRPGGHLIVGLYNRYGRLALGVRRQVFRATGGRGRWLDPYLREGGATMSAAKRDAWFADQYQHPHESKHTYGQVLGWFEQAGLDFVTSVPKPKVTESFDEATRLFEREPSGAAGRVDRALSQAWQIVTGSREGGFFVMIGRQREEMPS